jgi:hypothetical protein
MNNKSNTMFYGIFGVTVTVLFGIIMFHQLKHGDFPQHIAWAREFSENGYLYKFPHTLFARFVTIIRALLPANILVWVSVYAKQVYDIKAFEISTLIVMVLSYLAAAFIIVKSLLREWNELKMRNLNWLAGLGAIIILIVAPIFFFTYPDRMFLGYAPGNRYDSPTYVLLKPFALLMFIGITDNLFTKWSWKKSLAMVIFILCASLAKPSFTLTILPALGVTVVLFYGRKLRNLNWLYIIGPIGATSVVVLLLQFVIAYSGDRGDRVLLAPFKTVMLYTPNIALLAFLIIMSILFPLLVTLLYWNKIKDKLNIQLAWINFFIALVFGLIFAEQANFGSNNFWNGVMIGAFFLFFVTVSYFGKILITRKLTRMKLLWKEHLLMTTLCSHLLCGIIYFMAILNSNAVMVN